MGDQLKYHNHNKTTTKLFFLKNVSLCFTISLLSSSQRANLRSNNLRPNNLRPNHLHPSTNLPSSMHRNENDHLFQNGAVHLRSPIEKNDHRRQNHRLLQIRIRSKTSPMHQNGRTMFQRDLLQKRTRTCPDHPKSHEIRPGSRHQNGQIPRKSSGSKNRQSSTMRRLHENRYKIPTRSLPSPSSK